MFEELILQKRYAHWKLQTENYVGFNFGKNCDKKDKKKTKIYLQTCRIMQCIIKKLNLLPLSKSCNAKVIHF